MSYCIKYVSDNNDIIEFEPSHILPLSWDDFNDLSIVTMKMNTEKYNFNGESKTGNAVINFPVKFNAVPNIFALIRGGWLPYPFVDNPYYIVDRNIISDIESGRKGGFWFDLDIESEFTFNPILYSYEGKEKRKPTFDEYKAEYDRACKALKTKYPNCKIINFTENGHIQFFDNFLSKFINRHKKEAEFLIEVAPALTGIDDIENSKLVVLKNIKKYGLKFQSLIVLCVLSCIYKHTGNKSIGKEIIKPNKEYSLPNAHNAIHDIMLIELTAVTQCYEKNKQVALVTSDMYLSKLWCCLLPTARQNSLGGYDLDFKINKELFNRFVNDDDLKAEMDKLQTDLDGL